MFSFSTMIKSVIATVVAAGATYVGVRFGLPIPVEAQNWFVEALVALAVGGTTGIFTWLAPANKPKDRQAPEV
jgi:hypothetical protein